MQYLFFAEMASDTQGCHHQVSVSVGCSFMLYVVAASVVVSTVGSVKHFMCTYNVHGKLYNVHCKLYTYS